MKRIAIFLPNWVGDVVMATPAIHAVWQHFTNVRLVAVGKPYVAGVIEGSPWFEKLIPYDKRGPSPQRTWNVARSLRAMAIDAALLFPNSFRTALVARLAGAKTIVGFNRYGRGMLLTHCLEPQRDHQGRLLPCPIIDDYNRLAITLGTRQPGHRLRLFTTPEDEAAADSLWHHFHLHRYPQVVLLNPGGAFGSAKHWPVNHFATLARRLAAEAGCGVVVLCGPGERLEAARIAEASRSKHVVSLAEWPLSLGLTKAIVRRANLLVTTDSGPRHFAAAFDVPVITLFGPTHIAWTETYFDKATHLQRRVPCGPCQLRVCPLDHRCMKELSPQEVLQAALPWLNRSASWPPRDRHAA